MSTLTHRPTASSTAGSTALAPHAAGPVAAPAPTRPLAARRGGLWLQRIAWTFGRTGRPGLLGVALLAGAALFLVTTHRQVAAETAALRADLAAAQRQARPPITVERATDPAPALRALPARAEVPALLLQLFTEATRAKLAVDTARYDVTSMKSSGVVRHQITFPVTGPYPQIRAFLDATLAAMPAVALTDLALERKSIADGDVEAQLRMTVYTRSGP